MERSASKPSGSCWFLGDEKISVKAVGRYDKTPQLFEGTHFFRLEIHKRRNKTDDDFYKCIWTDPCIQLVVFVINIPKSV